ncbi:hypothetical protein [Virgibacillus phasianinus]|nr:hypothetical protein [Virgibacillus phasianinus]
MKEISELENADEILNLPNSWEERGIKKGIERGFEKGIKQIARRMLEEGSPINFISKVTGMDEEEIKKL